MMFFRKRVVPVWPPSLVYWIAALSGVMSGSGSSVPNRLQVPQEM